MKKKIIDRIDYNGVKLLKVHADTDGSGCHVCYTDSTTPCYFLKNNIECNLLCMNGVKRDFVWIDDGPLYAFMEEPTLTNEDIINRFKDNNIV